MIRPRGGGRGKPSDAPAEAPAAAPTAAPPADVSAFVMGEAQRQPSTQRSAPASNALTWVPPHATELPPSVTASNTLTWVPPYDEQFCTGGPVRWSEWAHMWNVLENCEHSIPHAACRSEVDCSEPIRWCLVPWLFTLAMMRLQYPGYQRKRQIREADLRPVSWETLRRAIEIGDRDVPPHALLRRAVKLTARLLESPLVLRAVTEWWERRKNASVGPGRVVRATRKATCDWSDTRDCAYSRAYGPEGSYDWVLAHSKDAFEREQAKSSASAREPAVTMDMLRAQVAEIEVIR